MHISTYRNKNFKVLGKQYKYVCNKCKSIREGLIYGNKCIICQSKCVLKEVEKEYE